MAGRQLPDRDQGSATRDPARTRLTEILSEYARPLPRLFSASAVAAIAFACYRATLLPGLDFGDTASFQTGVGSLALTPRQAYPLYYALGHVFVWLNRQESAWALNLASAVYGALACGAATWVAAVLAESLFAGAAGGLFLAFSYTFWSQAVIAEVYTLHLLMAGLSLGALLAWGRRPGIGRLAIFYAIYALGFGNHLSMILLLPGYAVFLLMERRANAGSPLQTKAVALAIVLAAAGALQYAWNFRGLWREDIPPTSVSSAIGRFWFDVTKADWRQSLVLGVSDAGLHTRPAMYWFDLQQQFGIPGVALAAAGFLYLMLHFPRRALLLGILYGCNLAFAWTYNVGDVHVFFLPAHLVVALCAGAGVESIRRLCAPRAGSPVSTALAALCLLYPAWRGYDTYPAVDRSQDHRPTHVLDDLTAGVDEERAVLAVDSNWQIQNAVEYYARQYRPGLAWFVTEEVPPNVAQLVRANADIGRRIIATPLAIAHVMATGTGRFEVDRERQPESLAWQIAKLPAGTVYSLAVLQPDREFPIDAEELKRAALALSRAALPIGGNYRMMIGRVADRPMLMRVSDRPFRETAIVGSLRFEVRMESWLPTDTIRRAGFGHVIVNHRHALTLERGISLLALSPDGRVLLSTYASGLFAPQPRYLLRLKD